MPGSMGLDRPCLLIERIFQFEWFVRSYFSWHANLSDAIYARPSILAYSFQQFLVNECFQVPTGRCVR
jgi:hypothetical protein